MDNKYLNKVVDQLVSETKLDHDNERVYTPFYSPLPFFLLSTPPSLSLFSFVPRFFSSRFSHHCKDVYGLNDEEVSYVWDRYREIVKVMSPL